MTQAAIRDLERETDAALTEYRRTVVLDCADRVEDAPMHVFGSMSEEFAAGYRQCREDMEALLRKMAKEGT